MIFCNVFVLYKYLFLSPIEIARTYKRQIITLDARIAFSQLSIILTYANSYTIISLILAPQSLATFTLYHIYVSAWLKICESL